jgi:non-homologous end joining protein Ku
VKGVEISKGLDVIVDPDELAPFVPLATKTTEVEEFVNLAEIDPIYFETSYYVAPTSPRSATHSSPRRWSQPARWRSCGS